MAFGDFAIGRCAQRIVRRQTDAADRCRSDVEESNRAIVVLLTLMRLPGLPRGGR